MSLDDFSMGVFIIAVIIFFAVALFLVGYNYYEGYLDNQVDKYCSDASSKDCYLFCMEKIMVEDICIEKANLVKLKSEILDK